MNGALLSLIFAVIGGALLAIQAPTNAILGKASGSPATIGGKQIFRPTAALSP